MRVMLATICLNEMEWLPRLYEQHKDWPGLAGWVFVEGSDPVYQKTNPDRVSRLGLSVDGTTEYLESIRVPDSKLFIFQYGSTPLAGDQGKCYLRNKYLSSADILKPDIIVQLDADEFYTKQDQERINRLAAAHLVEGDHCRSLRFLQRHIWRPPSVEVKYTVSAAVRNPIGMTVEQIMGHAKTTETPHLFSQEVVGGYWSVPHTRVWKYLPGMHHIRNHNWPEVSGEFLTDRVMRGELMDQTSMPQCVHLGYASSPGCRKAKHEYYKARGEGSEGGRLGRKRTMYVECRESYENWRPGDKLPSGAEVIRYNGPIPEVFR
jgi:hypothetical protein